MLADGTQPRQLTTSGNNESPNWSPRWAQQRGPAERRMHQTLWWRREFLVLANAAARCI